LILVACGCEEPPLSFSNRIDEIRVGFEPTFWVANFTEIFERVAYYGTSAVLAIYLSEQLHFSSELASALLGIAGGVVYALAIVAGALADRYGFRRTLMCAYLILTIGYFLLGSLETPWMEPLRRAVGDPWLVSLVLLVPALGPGMVKPCVAGTIARASAENVRSLGYSIYYTLVNVGGMLGPLMAWTIRKYLGLGIPNVFRAAAASVFLMFWVVLFFYREPGRADGARVTSVKAAFSNMFVVLGNWRFVLFLLISSGFYVVFFQIYISMPIFMRKYVEANAPVDLLLLIEGLTVICFQILATYLTRKMLAVRAIALGFLIAGLAFLFLAIHPGVFSMAALLVVLALGEITQASRYYEYCSRLAPPGQQGVYMGYAFLPIAIGSSIAGVLGGYLLHLFGEILLRPQQMWWVIAAIGVITAAAMWLYDKMIRPAVSAPASL
jgi:POT family proton-dependent oligopeptide transporter